MKLSNWAKQQGIAYGTAYKWFYAGLIPNARQLPTGTIMVDELANSSNCVEKNTVIYCRVSNQSRKKEMKYQEERLLRFAEQNGYVVSKVYSEVASGMNDNRKQFWKMLDSNPTTIIIENKDRLTRFGFNYLNKLLRKQGCSILVVNVEEEDEKDLMKDLVSIITSFCCRLYGLRRGKNKAERIEKELKQND